ncbi:MAG TPA: NAD-dependent epimerase/dehydratase family protein [Candidatus Brocadiaceae bacterium]
MKKRRILVCGATGFIGRNIAEYLTSRNDLEVYGVYLKSEPLKEQRIKMIKADLTVKNEVDRVVKGVDIIIQAAATTSGSKDIVTKPYIHVTDNAVMNSLIFRSAYENNVSHIVFFSCSVMYQPSNTPLKETDFNANHEIFPNYFGVGWTKVYIEKMCEFYSRLGHTKYTVIRHSNIYGPHDKFDLERSHVFGATMTKVMTANNGKIIVWGNGEEERDLLYVSDLADFVETVVDRQESRFALFNIGYNSAISIDNLVKKIIACSGKDIKIEYDLSKPSIKTKMCLDTTKARTSFGWVPRVSLDEGIRKMMEWYKINILRGE